MQFVACNLRGALRLQFSECAKALACVFDVAGRLQTGYNEKSAMATTLPFIRYDSVLNAL